MEKNSVLVVAEEKHVGDESKIRSLVSGPWTHLTSFVRR